VQAKEPFIVGVGGRAGQSPERPLSKPLGTITSKGDAAICVATLAPFLTECANASSQRTFSADDPLRTQCAQVKGGHFAMVSAFLTKFNTGSVGFSADTPMHTITAGGIQARPGTAITQGVVVANLVHYHADKRASDVRASDLREPIKTQTTENRHALVTSNLIKLRGTNVGSATDEPLHTISAQGLHHAEVRAFLIKYYGTDQDPAMREPLHTITTKDRFGLVTVHGEEYAIVDIGLRMLTPRELYRAQGFPESYQIDSGADGKPLTKTAQVRMCGNSVCPPLSCAIVSANYSEISIERKVA